MTTLPEPHTFEEAVSRFEEFLRQNGYPPNLVWVEPTDLLLSGRGAIYVKLPVPAENLIRARERFGLGINKGLGILLGTICYLRDATCCYAWVPQDHEEQQRHLMCNGLKLSATTDSRRSGRAIMSHFYWYLLKRRYQKYSRMTPDLFA